MATGRPGRRAPRWAVWCAVSGAFLMLLSGGALVTAELALSRVTGAIREGNLFGQGGADEEYGEDIRGPLNILLAGLDTRPSRPDETPRADAIMVVHINRELDRAYLISFPRDALVDIPADPAIGYPGESGVRLNTAMFQGADPRPGEEHPNIERGFALLARTMSGLTGIERFDAGVVLNFVGFEDIVAAMGGIRVTLDERIVSRHRQPDGKHRPVGCGSYCGPQMVYEPGAPPCAEADQRGRFRCELNGWQALDVVRQRYGIEGGDYGRQQNQQRVLEAMVDRAFSRDMVTNPLALDNLLQAVGDSMIFDGRGNGVVDFAFALRDIRPGAMQMIGLPGDSVGVGSAYQGEQLRPVADEVFAALRLGQLDQFVLEHRDLVR